MLGFQVVARLAARHQVKVMLTTTPGGTGVTAIVRLPRSVLEAVGAPLPIVPAVEVPAVAQRVNEPLTDNAGPAPISLPPQMHVPLEMTDEALWAAMSPDSASIGQVTNGSALSMAPQASAASDGLSKRVPGAQLPDLGVPQSEVMPPRLADEVRSTLTSLQRGVELGRHHEQKS